MIERMVEPTASRARGRRRRGLGLAPMAGTARVPIVADPYRAVVFPNRVREHRMRRGHAKLFGFAAGLPDIPYIRLSKIERGEVFARADELVRIAAAIGAAPGDLLLDIDDPAFDIATWFLPFADGTATDSPEDAEFALLLAAAVRAQRDADPALTAAAIDADYAIPPVILSRIENAQKGLARWNDQTVANMCRLLGVADVAMLRDRVAELYEGGMLDPYLAVIVGAEQRVARTRQRVAALAVEIDRLVADRRLDTPGPTAATAMQGTARLVRVYGMPLADGLIAMTATDSQVEAPAIAGPRAFGLRIGRATLGGGLPGQATVIVDPDRFPQAGGLALVRDGDGHRIVAVAIDRAGRLLGYTTTPDWTVAIDTLPPADVAAVVAAQFV